MRIYMVLFTETINVWHYQLVDSLRDMGHTVVMPTQIGLNESWYRRARGRWSFRHRRELGRRLEHDIRQQIAAGGLDLIIAYVMPFQFEPAAFAAISRLGIPTVLYNCDNLNSHTIANAFAPHFTLTWVPELDAVPLYRRVKCDFIYLPMAANPRFNVRVEAPEQREIMFVGSKNPYRRWLLGTLIEQGLPVEIFGSDWRANSSFYSLDDQQIKQMPEYPPLSAIERVANLIEGRLSAARFYATYTIRGRMLRPQITAMGERFEEHVAAHAVDAPVSHLAIHRLFAESKVSLGINQYIDPACRDPMHMTYSRMRDFEAPMSGACYLTQHTGELEHLFPEPGAVETYRTIDELRRKARRLLNDPDARSAMRVRARQYALAHHTWQHRFTLLFKRLGLSAERSIAVSPGRPS